MAPEDEDGFGGDLATGEVRRFAVVRDDTTPTAWVGKPGRSLLDLVAIKQDLEDVLHCSVDLVTEEGLSPYLRDRPRPGSWPMTT